MAQITVDTKESLDSVLSLLSAAYGVNVGVVGESAAPAKATRGRRPGTGRRGRPAKAKAAPAKTARRGRRAGAAVSSSEVREWARAHGHTVSDRGRLPAPILEAYQASRS
jgi:Lsr2 protein